MTITQLGAGTPGVPETGSKTCKYRFAGYVVTNREDCAAAAVEKAVLKPAAAPAPAKKGCE